MGDIIWLHVVIEPQQLSLKKKQKQERTKKYSIELISGPSRILLYLKLNHTLVNDSSLHLLLEKNKINTVEVPLWLLPLIEPDSTVQSGQRGSRLCFQQSGGRLLVLF